MSGSREMDAKHTPGPWEIAKYTNFQGYSIWAKDRGCIAERWYDKDQEQPYGSEIAANAALIAAAPVMYDALRAVREAFNPKACSWPIGAPNSEARRQQDAERHALMMVDAALRALGKEGKR